MNIIQYENYQEKRDSTESPFPYLTYPCSIPLDFPLVPLHWHDEMEFVYIKKGRGLVSVDFTPFEVEAGDIIIICPGQLHTIEQLPHASMEYENIIFPLTLLGSRQPDTCWEQYLSPVLRRQASLPAKLTPAQGYYRSVAACIDEIDQIRRTFPGGYELLIKGKLFELFFHLYSGDAVLASGAYGSTGPDCSCNTSGSSALPGSAGFSGISGQISGNRQKSMDKTRLILKIVEEHYSEKLSIKEMAEACGFSQSHFMKFFKTTIGVSFTSYLNDYRLTMASRLLLSSEDSILTIAGDTGFDNLSYFNRVFKQRFGMTPREFRRQENRVP